MVAESHFDPHKEAQILKTMFWGYTHEQGITKNMDDGLRECLFFVKEKPGIKNLKSRKEAYAEI